MPEPSASSSKSAPPPRPVRTYFALEILLAAAIAGLLVCHGASAAGPAAFQPPRWRVQQEEIGPRQAADEQRAMSADGRRYAYVKALEGGQYAVVVDGKVGPPFKDIREESLTFSADGTRLGYAASQSNGKMVAIVDGHVSSEHDQVAGITFSRDGKRAGYLAQDKNRWVPVVDGRALGISAKFVANDSIQLGNGGRGILFSGSENEDGWSVNWNAKQLGSYDGMQPGAALMFKDGRRVAFAAQRGDAWSVLVNGQAGPRFEGVGRPSAGPGEAHWLYVGKKAGKMHVVVDEKVGPAWDELAWARFSDDGRHVIYLARKGTRWTPVVDGTPGPEFDELMSYRLAPDTSHVAYVAREGKTWRSVVNGQVAASWDASDKIVVCEGSCWGRTHATPSATSLRTSLDTRDSVAFSRDGRHVARTLQKDDRVRVVLDGVPGPDFFDVDPSSLYFSDDGKHLAYKARGPQGWLVVVDGERGPELDSVERPAFRPDGSIVYFAENGRALFRIRHLPGEPKATR